MIPRAVFLAVALAATGASAEPGAPLSAAEQQSLDAFAAANAECLEWSDGCVVCVRLDKGFACSTPGIACTPSPFACRRPGAPRPPAKP